MTTKLELEVSDKAIRKLKALSALEGYTSPAQMASKAAVMFEAALDEEIRCHLGEAQAGLGPTPASPRRPYKVQEAPQFHAVSADGLSDGLGDEHDYDAEEPEAETDAFAMVPKIGGLSDREIEKDMEVEDPEHEAAAEPPGKANPEDDPEELFIHIAGVEVPTGDEEHEIDHRILKRKKRVNSRAKVTGLLEDAQISESF